jgi:deoxyribonuclease V
MGVMKLLACVDVDYRADGTAVAACLTFPAWDAAFADRCALARSERLQPYEPGKLYLRELPCILAALLAAGIAEGSSVEAIIVDAYVTLDPIGTPGLGAHLHTALKGTIPVVGVAKTPYASATTAIAVVRGESRTPLWVSAIGLAPELAAERVRDMHGPYRIPTLLRRVDRAARDAK